MSSIHRGIPQPNELPHYCILGYGPVIDRDIFMLTEEQNKKDFSHFQSFSRIMQHSINADSEAEVIVDSSYQGSNETPLLWNRKISFSIWL